MMPVGGAVGSYYYNEVIEFLVGLSHEGSERAKEAGINLE
jgi:hypothetical protein